MLPRVRTILVTSMVVLLLLVSAIAGCLSDEDNGNGNGNGDEDPVLANAGNDLFGEVGQALTLNASSSSGPVQKYTWTIGGPNASAPNNVTKFGEEVEHTFTEAGAYKVTLLVEGKEEDNNSTDTMNVYIDRLDSIEGTLQASEGFNKTYEYGVYPEVQSIKLTLTYPTTVTVQMVPVKVDLDMDVFTDEQTLYATTSTQPPDTGNEQVEELTLELEGVVTNGGFDVVIRWGPLGAPAPVDFTLDVEIYYRAV